MRRFSKILGINTEAPNKHGTETNTHRIVYNVQAAKVEFLNRATNLPVVLTGIHLKFEENRSKGP